jgi:hypothetical protein
LAFADLRPIYGGVLWKKGDGLRTWRTYLFVLSYGYLFYYDSERDLYANRSALFRFVSLLTPITTFLRTPRGVISLKDARVSENESLHETLGHGSRGFSIKALKGWNVKHRRCHKNRGYTLITDSNTGFLEWAAILSRAAEWG